MALPAWWKYDLGAGVTKTVQKVRIKPYYDADGGALKDFTVQGSNDNSAWTILHTGQHANGLAWENYTFTNSIAYRYYRINVTSNWRAGYPEQIVIQEFEMMEYPYENISLVSNTMKAQSAPANTRVTIFEEDLRG